MPYAMLLRHGDAACRLFVFCLRLMLGAAADTPLYVFRRALLFAAATVHTLLLMIRLQPPLPRYNSATLLYFR